MVTHTHWVADAAAERCQDPHCTRQFSLTVRRHHCRRCGLVFCSDHVSKRLRLDSQANIVSEAEQGRASKVCEQCWEESQFRLRVADPTRIPVTAQQNQQDVVTARTRQARQQRSLETQQVVYEAPSAAAHATASDKPFHVPPPWVAFFAVAKFDIDVGQVLEAVYPRVPLTQADEAGLSFLAFPDSNADEMDDLSKLYVFVYKQPAEQIGANAPRDLFGTVYFRQKLDPTVRRGAVQRSLLLLSYYPFVGFLSHVLQIVGDMFFDDKHTSTAQELIASAYEQISAWPPPLPAMDCELPLFGSVLDFRVPSFIFPPSSVSPSLVRWSVVPHKKHSGSNNMASEEAEETASTGSRSPTQAQPAPVPAVLAEPLADKHKERQASALTVAMTDSIPQSVSTAERRTFLLEELSLHTIFSACLPYLWKIWEILMVGEPLIILSPCSRTCSYASLAAASLVAPMGFCGVLRPFFGISSAEMDKLLQIDPESFPCILGSTNVFFAKMFENWPHVLALTAPQPGSATQFDKKAFPTDNKGRQGLMATFRTKLFTSRRFVIHVERSTLKLCADALNDGEFLLPFSASALQEESQHPSRLLRAYFTDLTKKFLAPLESCFHTIWLQAQPTPFLANRHQCYGQVFRSRAFVDYVDRHGYPTEIFRKKHDKDDALEFYRRFTKTNTFHRWLADLIWSAQRLHIMRAADLPALATDLSLGPESHGRLLTKLNELLQTELDRPALDSAVVRRLQRLCAKP